MSLISIEEFHNGDFQNLQEGDVILDVRTPEEYQASRIPGSINIPHDQVADRHHELEGSKRVFIHCKRGARAQVAWTVLQEMNPDYIMICIGDGGTERWFEANFPSES